MLITLFRVVLTGLLLMILVGFGLCGLYGTIAGFDDLGKTSRGGEDFSGVVFGFGVIGLGIAAVSALCLFLLRRKWRKARN